MTTPVQQAVDAYILAASERDSRARARLLESCLAEDAVMVSTGREFRGRDAIAKMLDRAHADPEFVGIRMVSAIDARGTLFRYRAVADFRNGTSLEAFDAGQIDASGRISLILTFSGPLADAANPR
ncbi:MAG: hypothetical protein RL033_7000 [Pseudomonadota bacterium]|jgi:hypothetical protein